MSNHPTFEKRFVASFDVDAQNTFTENCPNELPVPEGTAIVPELNAQAKYAKLRLGSKDAHSPHAIWVANSVHPALTPLVSPEADCYWPEHAVPGTLGFELIDGLPPVTHYDYFVWKGIELSMHPYGVCFHDLSETMSTGVSEYLRANQIEAVIVGGLCTEYCVLAAVQQLLKAQFKVIVNRAACRGLSADNCHKAYETMLGLGAFVVPSSEHLAEWITV